MTISAGFAPALAAALHRASMRAARMIAAEVPRDVRVAATRDGIRVSGRRLSTRSLVDARLRDFAAIVRTGEPPQ